MNSPLKNCILSLAIAGLGVTSAMASEPIDKPAYKIYISSPLEQWSGNASELVESAKNHAARQASYRVALRADLLLMGHPTVFQKPTDHPIVNAANKELGDQGFTVVRDIANFFQIEAPVSVSTKEAATILDGQASLRRRFVIAQGDPETLQSRVSTKKFVGAVAAIGLTVVAADKFGASVGASATLGSGLSDDVYRTIARHGSSMVVPVALAATPPDDVYHVDFRRVTSRDRDRTGQLVIFYKTGKTDAIEAAALQDAILVLSGAIRPPQQIQSARELDLAERQAIWRECIDKGECKK